MELRHLRYAVAVAEELHFGRAAARLNISQPPLSQQIKQLEEELGIQLFRRTKRQVQLTEPGALFVADARIALAQAAYAATIGDRVKQGVRGRLTIGMVTPADSIVFQRILRRFGSAHPEIRIVLRSMTTADQLDALRDGRLQLGFTSSPIEDKSLDFLTVLRQPLAVAMPEGHRLAKRRRVSWRALALEPHILFPRHVSPGHYDLIAAACLARGVALNVVHEVDNTYTAFAMVAAGLGVSIVPAFAREALRSGILIQDLEPPVPFVELRLAYRAGARPHVIDLFVTTVKNIMMETRKPSSGSER
jgi:DNA-binding transcriptional LysR family regulator